MDQERTEGHLRAASDAILLLVTEVEQSERQKRAISPGDTRFSELATAVRMAAKALADFAREEEEWGRTAPIHGLDMSPIAESTMPPSLAPILQRWRAIERALDHAPAGSPEARRLVEEFQRLRDEYMTAFRAHEEGG
jgi:hypothetical protein